MNVVVLEDEPAVADYLSINIQRVGYQVQRFQDLKSFQTWAQECLEGPEVFVLDRLIHREDSADLLLLLRSRFPDSRILFLSAIGSSQEKIRLLNAGADDYLSKPFAIEELIARIKALSRRVAASADHRIELGNVHLNPLSQTTEISGQKIELSKKEFQVLSLLVSQPTRVFSRVQLLESIWDIRTEMSSNVVEVTIRNLRRKLESAGANIKLLSKRYIGYWIEA